jgi:hypothetical protein
MVVYRGVMGILFTEAPLGWAASFYPGDDGGVERPEARSVPSLCCFGQFLVFSAENCRKYRKSEERHVAPDRYRAILYRAQAPGAANGRVAAGFIPWA